MIWLGGIDTPHYHIINIYIHAYIPLTGLFSFRLRDNALVLSALDVLQGSLEVLLRRFETGGFGVGLEIGVDELDEAVYILRGHLMGFGLSVSEQILHGALVFKQRDNLMSERGKKKGKAFLWDKRNSPSHSADRSSRHSDSGSRQTARRTRRCPCTHRPPVEHAAGIPALVCRLGKDFSDLLRLWR